MKLKLILLVISSFLLTAGLAQAQQRFSAGDTVYIRLLSHDNWGAEATVEQDGGEKVKILAQKYCTLKNGNCFRTSLTGTDVQLDTPTWVEKWRVNRNQIQPLK